MKFYIHCAFVILFTMHEFYCGLSAVTKLTIFYNAKFDVNSTVYFLNENWLLKWNICFRQTEKIFLFFISFYLYDNLDKYALKGFTYLMNMFFEKQKKVCDVNTWPIYSQLQRQLPWGSWLCDCISETECEFEWWLSMHTPAMYYN